MTTTASPSISTVSPADKDRAIATVTAAFVADPIGRWFLPDSQQYFKYWPEVLRRMAGGSFEGGSAHAAAGFQGAALWLKPGVEPDNEALGALMVEAIPQADQESRFAFFEQMGQFHPEEHVWYLPMIGVDPAYQGSGIGSALLSHALAQVDREHMPAYLEATSPRSRDLYLRHGFQVAGTVQAGDSPPLFPMLRKAR